MSYNYFTKKKWTSEQEQWLIEHKDIRGKQLMYETFMKAFPDAQFTANAISTKRTELGAYGNVKDRYSNARPLYSERVKKGYVQVKVSKCEWWPKQKFIWVASHPGEPFDIRNQFIFLDGDNRNFSVDNIMKVDHRVMGILNRNYRGLVKGNAELNRTIILEIMLKLAYLDKAEGAGLTTDYGVGRMLRSDRNRLARERNARLTPEQKARRCAYVKERYKINKQNPEWLEKHRAYKREYAKAHRGIK